MRKYYKCTSKEQRRAVLAALFALGYVWHKKLDALHTPEQVEERYSFDYYHTLITNTRDGSISGSYSALTATVSLEDLLVPYVPKPEPIRVQLGEYVAVVQPDNDIIEVGCQNINIAMVREIVAAWEKLNPAKTSAPA